MTNALPIDSLQAELKQKLSQHNLVVTAATGSGKSTRIPLWAAELGKVLVVQPRRIACMALAEYLAEQSSTAVGECIGYAIRGEYLYSEQSKVVFATPGIALRWFSEDRLAGFEAVMLDEFHERRWDMDLLLALLRQHQKHKLILTSATMDHQRLAEHCGALHLHAEGRSYPVTVNHQSADVRDMPTDYKLDSRVVSAVESVSDEEGDVLVFLPGRREITQCAAALRRLGLDVIELYAGTDKAQQRRALRLESGKRIILATNVAETSLTIPAVTVVIDSGLERRTHQRNGRTVLALHAISKASADQRKGRAGRVRAGRCIRLYGEHAPMELITPPEVQREELDEMILAAGCSGYIPAQLDFLDPLPAKSEAIAVTRLQKMQALDDVGRVTEHGRNLYPLPIDSLFAHLITSMPDAQLRWLMVEIAAGLSQGTKWFKRPVAEDQQQLFRDWIGIDCDLILILRLMTAAPPEFVEVDQERLTEARRLAEQIADGLTLELDRPKAEVSLLTRRNALLAAIAKVSPELVYVRREKRRQAFGNGFTEVSLPRESQLADSVEAGLVLDQFSLPGRGTRQTLNLATAIAPITLKQIIEWQLAELQQGEAMLEESEVMLRLEHHYAGRKIGQEVCSPSNAEQSCHAIASLIRVSKLMPNLWSELERDIAAWNLYLALGVSDETVADQSRQPAEPFSWLLQQLKDLGLEAAEDLELLAEEDLRFQGIPDWQRESFDSKYPLQVSTGDMLLDIHYDIGKKIVTAEKISGLRKTDPKRRELPVWSGWRVKFRKASRVVDIR